MSLPAYVIPDTALTVAHVNATDLSAGTARIGGAWTQNGSPVLVPAGPLNQSVVALEGVFSSVNYFSQASSPVCVAAAPFCAAVLLKITGALAPATLLAFPSTAGLGPFIQMLVTGVFRLNGTETSTVSCAANSGHLVVFGSDGVNGWLAVDGETPVLGAVPALSTGTANLGRSATQSWNGSISEFWFSTDTPTANLFASIYATVLANLTVATLAPPASLPVANLNALPQGIIAGVDFGSDIDATFDLNPEMVLLSGHANVAQAILHRLQTPRGSLFYDPNYGTDVRAFLNDSMTPVKLSKLRNDVQAECLKDERVQTCSCQAVSTPSKGLLTLTISLTLSNGPFVFVIAVTSLSVALLEPSSTVN